MKPVVFSCRRGDIKKVRITCRCGTRFIAEVPKQIAQAESIHPCPNCQAVFSVQQKVSGSWQIGRLADHVSNLMLEQGAPKEDTPTESVGCYIGLRVRLVSTRCGTPRPEITGQLGVIIDVQPVQVENRTFKTPVIRLDNGVVLTGAECWWEAVEQ